MGDLKDPKMEHSQYNLELNTITSYYNETTEIGKKARKWREEFKKCCSVLIEYLVSCLLTWTSYELFAYKTRVACSSVI
ncbi:hypothetical protein C1645_781706, partial [Glomus cerebriforme]